MAQIGSLVIDLIAETASFNANLKKASTTLNSEAAQMRRSIQSVQSSVNSMVTGFKALAAGVAVAGIGRVVASALDYASSLGEVAQQLGVTTEDLQVYRYAATQVGISQEEMDKGLAKLTRSLGEAQLGSKGARETFAALGISLTDSNGKFRSTSDILPQVANAISQISDPARRAAIEITLFGKAGQKLDTLLSGGSASVNELRDAAKSLGIVLSDSQIQSADATADKLSEVKKVLEARIAGVVADNAGAIFRLADAFLTLTSRVIGFLGAMDQTSGRLGQRYAFAAKASEIIVKDPKLSDSQKSIALARIQEGADKRFGIQATSHWYGVTRSEAPGWRAPSSSAVAAASAASTVDIDDLLAGGGSGGGKKRAGASAGKAARDVAAAQRELAQSLGEIIGKFDPAKKAAQDYADTLQQIDDLVGKGKVSASDALGYKLSAARDAATASSQAMQADINSVLGYTMGGADDPIQKMMDQQLEATDRLREFANDNEDASKRMKVSWADAAHGVIGSLQSITSGIQGGGFLDILGGVIDLLEQLGSIGVFGSKISANINGARAGGGPVIGGGTYLVGENGPELFTPGSSGMIVSNDNLRGISRREAASAGSAGSARMSGALAGAEPIARVHIVPSPYFDAVVDGRATSVAAPMAVQAGIAGSSVAQQQMRRRARNRIPG